MNMLAAVAQWQEHIDPLAEEKELGITEEPGITEEDEEPLRFDDAEDCDDEASQQTQTAADTLTMSYNPAKAHQPTGPSFPKRAFGKQHRVFSPSWHKQHLWLHYQEGNDTVCFLSLMLCSRASKPSS